MLFVLYEYECPFIRAYVYALCVCGAVSTQGSVWKFVCAIYFFIYSFKHVVMDSVLNEFVYMALSCEAVPLNKYMREIRKSV